MRRFFSSYEIKTPTAPAFVQLIGRLGAAVALDPRKHRKLGSLKI
jgi:hypothetical protein